MGLCMSKSSARSTPGSEKSEKCRWDKHGNVFFPVKRSSYTANDDGSRHQPRAFMNPVYTEFESPGHTRRGFSGISKILKGSKGPPLQLKRHPLSPSRLPCRDLLSAGSVSAGIVEGDQLRRHGTLLKFIEAEKNGTLSRSSSAKEGTLTRSSSAKEAALSRCSSQKEGRQDRPGDSLRSSPDHLATIAALKATNIKLSDGRVPDKAQENRSTDGQCTDKVEQVKAPTTKTEPSTTATKGLGLPCYGQPMVFTAGSPNKCRGRCESKPSSEESAAATSRQRRRSPNRRSPGKRSPRRCSPNRRAGGSTFVLNASAARFQRSLPTARTENLPERKSSKPPQVPKNVTERSALKELQINGLKPQHFRRHSSPVKPVHFASGNSPHPEALPGKPVPICKNSYMKSEKFSVFSDVIHLDIESRSSVTTEKRFTDEESPSCLAKEPRSGSKRLRSPKKFTVGPKENLKPSVLEDKFPGADLHTKDKHVDTASTQTEVQDKKVLGDDDVLDAGSCSPDPDLLELLERTPKKLKKMALKLALMIELEHLGGDSEEEDEAKQDVDVELKLGMPTDKGKMRNRDGFRVDLSVAMDSPARTESLSVPTTPRQSISSACNGLSVEARIGSSTSKHSDFSFHILKNPDMLFGSVPRFQISRTEQTKEPTSSSTRSSSVFHVDSSGNKVAVDLSASQEQRCDRCTHSNEDCPVARSDECPAPVQRCQSFGFENDKSGTPSPCKKRELDLNKDVWLEDDDQTSPGFEFQVKSAALKSLPATPVMPTAAAPNATETDALSLSADEIAEIWGAFEAGQEEICT